jgi:hypothetical protein
MYIYVINLIDREINHPSILVNYLYYYSPGNLFTHLISRMEARSKLKMYPRRKIKDINEPINLIPLPNAATPDLYIQAEDGEQVAKYIRDSKEKAAKARKAEADKIANEKAIVARRAKEDEERSAKEKEVTEQRATEDKERSEKEKVKAEEQAKKDIEYISNLAELQAKVKILNEEKEENKQRIVDFNAKIAELTKTMEENAAKEKKRQEDTELNIKKLKEEQEKALLAKDKEKQETLANQLAEALRFSTEKESEYNDSKSLLQTEIDGLNSGLEAANKVNEDLIQDNEKLIKDAEEEKKRTEEIEAKLKAENVKLNEIINDLNAEKDRLIGDITRLKDVQKESAEAAEENIKKQKKVYEDAMEKKDTAAAEAARLALETAEREKAELTEKHKLEITEKEQALKELETKLSDAEALDTKHQEEAKQAAADAQVAFEIELAQMTSAAEAATEENTTLKAQIVTLNEKIATLESKRTELEKKIQTLTAEQATEAINNEEKLTKLQAELKEITDQLEAEKADNLQKQKEAQEAAVAAEAKYNALQLAMTTEVDKLNAAITEKEKQLKAQEEKYNKDMKQLESELGKSSGDQKKLLDEEIKKLKEKHEKEKKELKEEIEKQKKEIEELNKKIADLENELEGLRNELAALKNRPEPPTEIAQTFERARTAFRNLNAAIKGTIPNSNLNLNKDSKLLKIYLPNNQTLEGNLITLTNGFLEKTAQQEIMATYFKEITKKNNFKLTFSEENDMVFTINKVLTSFKGIRESSDPRFTYISKISENFLDVFCDKYIKQIDSTTTKDAIKTVLKTNRDQGPTIDKNKLKIKKYFVYNLLLFYLYIINKVIPISPTEASDTEYNTDEWQNEGGGTLHKKLTKRNNRGKMKYTKMKYTKMKYTKMKYTKMKYTNMKYTKMKYTKKRNQKRKKNMSKKQRKHRQKKYTRKYI